MDKFELALTDGAKSFTVLKPKLGGAKKMTVTALDPSWLKQRCEFLFPRGGEAANICVAVLEPFPHISRTLTLMAGVRNAALGPLQ